MIIVTERDGRYEVLGEDGGNEGAGTGMGHVEVVHEQKDTVVVN